MMRNLSREGRIRVITYVVTAFVVLAILATISVVKANYYASALRANYTVSINSLTNHVTDMDESLEKCMYSGTSTMLCSTTDNLWRDAYEAREILSALPMDARDMESTNKFLAKVAEFSKSISMAVARGENISDENHKTLKKLKRYTEDLKKSLLQLQSVYTSDDSSLDRLDISFDSPEKLSKSALSSLSFTTTQETLTNAPQLIYDGPYSDSIIDKEPAMLKGKKSVSAKAAAKAAARYLSCSYSRVEKQEDENGNIPCYVFRAGSKTAAISKKGGLLVYTTDSSVVKDAKVSKSTCLKKAKEYLESLGYRNMSSNYYEKSGNMLNVSFHYTLNSVKCYTDIIKVNVRMDTGEVSEVDCRHYITNHNENRKFKPVKYNITEAKAKVNKYLTIRKSSMAVIPTKSENEKYVYEFLCAGEDKEDILVYIDPQTGEEADMLIVVKNENGVLTY